ncbi:carbohydrate ABC transporter permease [Georgenia sp. 311]|uniref:Carbohydrate ABC transporter permease n=1 Tax=Georgenia wutianyii TaxID=2585135 RepID=A0ABX5VMI1_9MICO|nr:MULTISPECIES: carbohydrate ABC transporter permease [Georgenia]QDB78996.1 carbohydrate ABC transporter permease [Georgenia wutianyii]TNC17246.1 carbohydrate ABC transporter permease [Georgenia sp. 311]
MTDRIRRTVLVVLGLLWLAPVYLMLANAAKTDDQYGVVSVWRAVGLGGLVENVSTAWTRGNISEGVASTALYSVVAPALAVLVGAGAGFAIVALRLRHGFLWFVVIFAATVLPMQMLLMPLFIGYVQTGLYDTRTGMVLVYTVISVPFAAFVMRNFFTGIAYQVFEAAVVDGASTWRIFWRIYLPMSTSALVAVFILQATLIWNDLLLGLTLTQSSETRPVMTALSALQSTYGGSTMPTVLAGGLIVSVPTVVLFLLTQRAFTRGLALGQF